MKKTLLSAASSIGIVTAALLFTGCGDSDSSSAASSSTAGTQTGQFVKGPWKGISYTRSNGVSGTTGVNGTFTYNPGENVTFNFGLGQAKWVSGSTAGNSTNPATAAITSCVNPQTSTAWTIADAGKVATVFSAFGVNESGMGSTDLSTLISSMQNKLSNINVSAYAGEEDLKIALNAAGISSVTGGISSYNASAVTNTTIAAKVTEVTNAAVAAATSSLPAGYNLSDTNKKIILSNGTATSFTKVNNTAINISGTTYSVLGALTGGVSLVSGNTSAIAKVVAYDMTAGGVNPNGKSISLSINGVNKTYTFTGTTSGTYTLNVSGSTLANGGGNWSATSDGLGIALIPSNATVGGANTTVTFEDDFTASNGTVAKLWSGAIGSITSAYATLVEVVYSTATTVLKHLH